MIQKIAILGTARAPLTSKMRQKLVEIGVAENLDSARALLVLAAVERRMARAGHIFPKINIPEISLFSAENLPVCSPNATRLLGQILRGTHARALPEFLKMVVFYKKNLPASSLPTILTHFFEKKLDARDLDDSIGLRGKWLAAQHPDWKSLLPRPPDSSTDFFTGTLDSRVVFLENARQKSPAEGLDLLKKTWAEDPFEHRARLLNALIIGLSRQDEPFLDIALQDKRREVRRVAIQLAAKIKGGRLAEQLFGLAIDSIDFSDKSGSSELVLDKKSQFISVLAHFESGSNAKIMATEFTILSEIFGLISPEKWTLHYSKSSEMMWPIFEKMGMMPSMLEAVHRFNFEEWQVAAVRFWAKNPNLLSWTTPVFVKIMGQLPPEILDTELKNAFSTAYFLLESNAPLTNFLSQSTHLWSLDMTFAFFKHLHYWLEKTNELAWNGWFLEDLMRKISWQAAPAAADFVAETWKTPPRYSPISPQTINQIGAIFNFRHRMRQAIAEP